MFLLTLLSRLPQPLLDSLLNLSFEALVTTPSGREIGKALIDRLINKYSGAEFSVCSNAVYCCRGLLTATVWQIDAIGDVLRSRCPSFFSNDDMILHKGLEYLRRTWPPASSQERSEMLHESLRLLCKVSASITPALLESIARDYLLMRFHSGVIQLALCRVRDIDPAGQGLLYYDDGMPLHVGILSFGDLGFDLPIFLSRTLESRFTRNE